MGSPAGSSGTGTGSTANVYTPTAQPAADTTLQGLIASFPSAATSPAGSYYGTAQDRLGLDVLSNPYAPDALTGASYTSDFTKNNLFPDLTGGATDLRGAAWAGLPYGGTALSQGFDPQYTANVTAAENNPYYAPALAGAQQAANIGTQGAANLAAGANQTLDTAYDPQGALYNKGRSNALDYSAVTNAQAGLGGTPYGSSVASGNLTNYDMNWQDRQLGRQEKALGTADTTLSDASKLASTASGLPSSVYTGNIKDISTALAARNLGAAEGGSTYSAITGASGAADTTAGNLETGAVKDYAYYSGLPAATAYDQGDKVFTGINDVVSLGNNQYKLPQQEINDLESYLKLGQSASVDSGNLGAQGLSELSSAASGIGGISNTLFGSNSGGLVGGASSLFSGGGAAGGASTLADFGAGGGVAAEAGTAALDAGASTGGSGLTALLPMLAS